MGGVIDHIRSWAATELKYWERAALDKISEETELSEETYEELLAYFLQDAGLLPAPPPGPGCHFLMI